jgi:hypothetical protein
MSETQTPLAHHEKYKASIGAYKETLYRSAFAIREELKPGLLRVVELSGAPSVSGMLAMLAEDPAACAGALKPIFDQLNQTRPPKVRRKHKVFMKDVMEQMRSGEVTPEELAAALQQVQAQKNTGV